MYILLDKNKTNILGKEFSYKIFTLDIEDLEDIMFESLYEAKEAISDYIYEVQGDVAELDNYKIYEVSKENLIELVEGFELQRKLWYELLTKETKEV